MILCYVLSAEFCTQLIAQIVIVIPITVIVIACEKCVQHV